jgi:transcriptional regulator of acetoin/glycerol metabolism
MLTWEDFLVALDLQTASSPASKPLHAQEDSLPRVGTISLDDIERAMILKAIETYPRNITQIAEALGISRNALYRRLEKYNIRL